MHPPVLHLRFALGLVNRPRKLIKAPAALRRRQTTASAGIVSLASRQTRAGLEPVGRRESKYGLHFVEKVVSRARPESSGLPFTRPDRAPSQVATQQRLGGCPVRAAQEFCECLVNRLRRTGRGVRHHGWRDSPAGSTACGPIGQTASGTRTTSWCIPHTKKLSLLTEPALHEQ
jgi:hypothetical protein